MEQITLEVALRPGGRFGPRSSAVLYYISQHFICWDFVGMTIQDPKIVGMDPNSLHPKPRPSTPRDSFDSILFQYQNEIA